ncbi:glycosyltransferase family 4 protein [Porticoccaceae bacterium]|nr:glycosyltransferase family 4 protein [Porticoccaceae bacterium]
MKILHAILGFHPQVGGAERQANLLAQVQTNHGHSVTVFTRGVPGYIDSEPFTIQRFWTNKFPASKEITAILIAIRIMVVGKNFDLVHVHQANVLAALIAVVCRIKHIPCYVKIANSGEKLDLLTLAKRPFGKILVKLLLTSRCKFIAITEYIKLELSQLYGIDSSSIECIPNGVVVASRYNKPDPIGRTIVFLGRLEPVKCPGLVLDLAQTALNFDYEIYGSGSLRDSLVSAINTDDIKNVALKGETDAPQEVLNRSTIMILPSFTEGLSNSILEALSKGVPVLVRDIPQNRFLSDGIESKAVPGVLVSGTKTSEWAAGVDLIMSNYDRFSRNAYDSAQKFNIELVAKKLESMYTR